MSFQTWFLRIVVQWALFFVYKLCLRGGLCVCVHVWKTYWRVPLIFPIILTHERSPRCESQHNAQRIGRWGAGEPVINCLDSEALFFFFFSFPFQGFSRKKHCFLTLSFQLWIRCWQICEAPPMELGFSEVEWGLRMGGGDENVCRLL